MSQLEVTKIRDGLWRWMAPHPEWTPEKGGAGGWGRMVGCVYVELPGAVVLIDPLVPPEGSADEARFWKALDGDVSRLERPVAVLLGNRYHLRSSRAVAERYRRSATATVWAHEEGRPFVGAVTDRWFRAGDRLPGGIEAYSASGLNPDETLFWIPEYRALVASDAILGAGGGELRVAPPSWGAPGDEGWSRYERAFRGELRRLLDLPIEIVLVAHGDPALTRGREALARALEQPAWGLCSGATAGSAGGSHRGPVPPRRPRAPRAR